MAQMARKQVSFMHDLLLILLNWLVKCNGAAVVESTQQHYKVLINSNTQTLESLERQYDLFYTFEAKNLHRNKKMWLSIQCLQFLISTSVTRCNKCPRCPRICPRLGWLCIGIRQLCQLMYNLKSYSRKCHQIQHKSSLFQCRFHSSLTSSPRRRAC